VIRFLLLVLLGGCAPSPRPEAAAPVAIYPAPRFLGQERLALPVRTACLDASMLPAHEALDAAVPSLLAAAGLRAPAPGQRCDLALTVDTTEPSLPGWPQQAWAASPAGERYAVAVRLDGGRASARLWAASSRAARWAVAAALSLVDGAGRVHAGLLVDAPAIATRGLIEGYYGTPLTTPERLCLFDAMVRLRQNLYLYGPKNDPFAHERWAEPYPPDGAAALANAARAARARDLDFVWSVSPGLPTNRPAPGSSISFASAADFARLTAKIDSLRALGVDRFALFLDDTARNFAWDADRAAFATPAAAHADLANRLDDYVTAAGAPHLLFVGAFYTSFWDGWRDYAATLGARLRPGIDVMWTGPHVYSETLAAADLGDVGAALGRPVVLWDNEPDVHMPLGGRAADLAPSLRGFLSNTVMLQQGYSFADLWSVLAMLGDEQWNPAGYDADASTARWLATAPCP
jgi:hyaluronoglucosaminidase